MTSSRLQRRATRAPMAAACLCAAMSAVAQTAPTTTDTVIITGNPLASPRLAAPASVLEGEELARRRGASLGDTLDGLPGVSATYFGPNANRPVVRGLDGDRVRLLNNGGGSVDASSLSFDHAVPIDPLVITRIEVLRGPAALLYGGSAVGGVVHTLDNRVPRDRVRQAGGEAELRLGGAAAERGAAVVYDGGRGDFALHIDAFGRRTDDLRVPRHVPLEGDTPLDATRSVRNSAAEVRGGAVGASWFAGDSRVGIAVDTYRSRYGIVAEPDITIDLKRDHLGLSGESAGPWPGIAALRWHANLADYRHQEIEGDGSVGTTFGSQGRDLRLEAVHRPIGPWRGVLGLQWDELDFEALGDEAFVPATRTRKVAAFALEELAWSGGTTSIGARVERVAVDAQADADPLAPKFGPAAQRRFSLASLSLAHAQPLAGGWSWSAGAARTERAPTDFELYADGVHLATGQYERGDRTLGQERGANLDLGLRWQSGPDHLQANVFVTRFGRFLSLEDTGELVDESGASVPAGTADALPLTVFRAVKARLAGVELAGRKRLAKQPWTLDATAQADLVRARNLDTGEPLPRIAPLRLRLGLDAARGAWSGRIEVEHARAQDRVPATDRATAGYTLVHLSLSWRATVAGRELLWFARLANAGDRLAYSAVTSASLRGLSPLPGRALSTGLRVAF